MEADVDNTLCVWVEWTCAHLQKPDFSIVKVIFLSKNPPNNNYIQGKVCQWRAACKLVFERYQN